MNNINQNKSVQKCLINGVAADYINIDDRSIHYGDGLFETMAYKNGKLLLWNEHLSRLSLGCKKNRLARDIRKSMATGY